jgi:hypothetical protein
MSPMKSGRRGMVGSLGAALLALTGSVWAGSPPQPVSADAAPQAWVNYAQRVSERLQSALSGDAETAQRFSVFFDQWVDADAPAGSASGSVAAGESQPADAALPTLKVRVWLDRKGHVTQVGFDEAAIGDEQAAADLRTLLLQQSVDAPPPRAMKQPVVIRLVPGAQL